MRTTGAAAPFRRDRRLAGVVIVGALLAAVLGGLPMSPAAAAPIEIQVPGAMPTIQGAIDAASAGDVVVVAPGTYHEAIDFKGKAIEVRSSAGPESTTIDGDEASHVVLFVSAETRASVLRGFTITGGRVAFGPTIFGGGVAIDDASPTIVGNVITGNDAQNHAGAGIGTAGGAPLIEDNHIVGNVTGPGGAGGGIFAGGAAEIVANVIEGNSAGGGGGAVVGGDVRLTGNVIRGNQAGVWDGGGVTVQAGHPVVAQNLITGNSAELRGGGVYLVGAGREGTREIVGNTIADNQSPRGSAMLGDLVGVTVVNNLVVGGGASTVLCDEGSVAPGAFRHNLVFGGAVLFTACPDQTGTDGNISADPLFLEPDDYRLQPESPAIDAGDNAVTSQPTDFDGLARITDGNGDGTPVIDMGAHEAETLVGKRQAMPYTVWTQPSGVPLDGLGAWVDVLAEPVAIAGQVPPIYVYGHYFAFVDGGGALGLLGLVTSPGGKSAVFGVVEPNGTEHTLVIPYNWSPGALYFPLVYQVGPGAWAAWVFDYSASTWTHVGILSLPASWGKLAPASVTATPWLGSTAGDCPAFPHTDVLFYPPVGYVGEELAVATAVTTDVGPGDCQPVSSTIGPWTRYRVGAPAAA